MRRLSIALASAIAVATLAATAGATSSDPKLLVLQRSDVPASFQPDRGQTRYWRNAAYVRGHPNIQKLVAGSGRVNGYAAVYNRRRGKLVDTILSFTHLCRTGSGAHVLFAHEDALERRVNAARAKVGQAYGRRSVDIADEGRLYASPTGPRFVTVFWRAGRTMATLSTWGLTKRQTLSLAQMLQHRIEKTQG